MLSKKEIGMIALAGIGVVGIGAFATGAIGEGGGGRRTGGILGSPGGLTAESFASTGVSSAKLASEATRPAYTPRVAEAMPKKYVSSGFSARKPGYVTLGYVPEAATQAYISNAGGSYTAPTFEGVGGTIIGGRYTPPRGLYPSKTQAGLTEKGLATQAKVIARGTGRAEMTAKGEATKKRIVARGG